LANTHRERHEPGERKMVFVAVLISIIIRVAHLSENRAKLQVRSLLGNRRRFYAVFFFRAICVALVSNKRGCLEVLSVIHQTYRQYSVEEKQICTTNY
jgi:hypothetical protein